jgi:hypothetical protein
VRFGILLAGIAAALALYSHSLPVYYDEPHFWTEVSRIGNIDAAQHFYIIQEKYLTAKYLLLDYSICLFIAGILSIIIYSIGFRNLKSPRNTASTLAIGIAAVGLSFLAYYTDGLLTMTRDLSPPWINPELPNEDSHKKILYFLLGWLAMHSIVLRKDFHSSRRFSSLTLDYIALGLLSSTILAGGFVVITLVGGQPIYAVPALLWFYFHLSLLAGKQSTRPME